MTFLGGNVYEGMFKNGKKHKKGLFSYGGGKKMKKCLFDEGVSKDEQEIEDPKLHESARNSLRKKYKANKVKILKEYFKG